MRAPVWFYRIYLSGKRWQKIVGDLKAVDYVFIEFGHNDESKEKVDRYTPPNDFRANLIKFVADVKSRKATPILLTPVMRRKFDKDGNFIDTHGEYPDIVRAVAKEYRVALVDMHRKSEAVLKTLGADDSRKLFLQLKAVLRRIFRRFCRRQLERHCQPVRLDGEARAR